MTNHPTVLAPAAKLPARRAIAYFRCSLQDGQKNSISIQQIHVRRWAHERGIEIVHEFCDIGHSGLDSDEPPAFTEMLDEWIKPRSDFGYVLCFDANRLGRFPASDSSATPVEMVHQNKKQLIFTSMGKP